MIDPQTSRLIAFLDANALFSIRVTNLTLEAASRRLFQVRWSDDVHHEWMTNLSAKNPATNPDAAAKRRAVMDKAFPDACVSNYAHLIPSLDLPDQKDRHVLAAAIAAKADVIVTFNTKDFPEPALEPFGIEVQHPDEFLVHQMTLRPDVFLSAAHTVRHRLQQPQLARRRKGQVATALAPEKQPLAQGWANRAP